MLDFVARPGKGARAMHVRTGVPLAPLTTLHLGGPATVIDVDDDTDFSDVASWIGANHPGQPPTCLGWGSNVLVSDDGTATPVLLMRTTGITAATESDGTHVTLTVRAGHSLPDLIEHALAAGLIGIETLAGVPGTVGAMPIQNVGAYGQETADTLTQVTAWDWQTSQAVTLPAADCRFGHRHSLFKRSHRWSILDVTFTLTRSALGAPIRYAELARALDVPLGTRLPAAEVSNAVIDVRRRKGMVLDPADPDNRSVGSIFLSPVITPQQADDLRTKGASPHAYSDGKTRVGASWLLREAGYELGQAVEPGVRISTKHFTLVADVGATAARFSNAAAQLKRHVQAVTGVELTFEPDPIGRIDQHQVA